MRCSDCNGGCFRRECLPQFQADRLALWRNPRTGDRYSYALGAQMPESRKERDILAKSKGFEWCSPSENASPEHAAANAYHQAVSQGASHEQAEAHAPWPQKPKRKLKEFVDKWAAKKKDWGDIQLRSDE